MITEGNQSKKDIKSMSLEELKIELTSIGEAGFRAGQVYSWLHQKKVTSFDEMSNLSALLRQKLTDNYYIARLLVSEKLVSKLDGTIKYLFMLEDGNTIEAVLMKYKHGTSICISTQVGCRMGCKFCASTLGGLVRNLTASEMLEEIYLAERDSGEVIGSLVLMGIGEPLDNYDNVIKFLDILSSKEGMNMSLRHVSLSTCGIVPKIEELMEHKYGLTLSISLHASNDSMRSATMPINNKYNIDELIQICKKYFNNTGRRISFEYALIDGVNDKPENAKELANLIKGMVSHVNLIPVNPVKERGYKRSSRENVLEFQKQLENYGINATIRRELGADINAACGQLRLNSAIGRNIDR